MRAIARIRLGVNSWVWVSPPTDAAVTEIAPRVKAMGFDLLELGVEHPGDWDPGRIAEILAANDLGASVAPSWAKAATSSSAL
jgi:D-psicose/D-tagatose/L-ribulose 3-epimerase